MSVPKAKRKTSSLRELAILRPNEDECVRFSFKHAQVPGQAPFSIDTKDTEYFLATLTRLCDVCKMRWKDFRGQFSKSLRNHPVKFDNDNVSVDGFTCLPDALREQVESSAFQFSVSANKYGRIVGFFVEDVFFIVWFDPNHEVYA